MKNLKPFSGDAKKEYKDAVDRKPKDSDSYSGDMHPPKKQICLYFMT